MHLKLPHALHYPITVLELLKQPGDNVEKSTPIFSYKYRTTVEEGDRSGNITRVEKDFPARFESSVEGTLKKWHIKAGAVISHAGRVQGCRLTSMPHANRSTRLDVAEFDEACDHSVQYGGICAICGKDMTESAFPLPWLSRRCLTIPDQSLLRYKPKRCKPSANQYDTR